HLRDRCARLQQLNPAPAPSLQLFGASLWSHAPSVSRKAPDVYYLRTHQYRVAHRPAATFTSCGPGSVNLTIALACAMMDSSAFVAITGNVPTPQFNRGPFQATYR